MNLSTPGLPVHHQLPEFTQTHAHWVGDIIQPSHPLSSPSPPAPNPSQHQGLFQWVNSSHEVRAGAFKRPCTEEVVTKVSFKPPLLRKIGKLVTDQLGEMEWKGEMLGLIIVNDWGKVIESVLKAGELNCNDGFSVVKVPIKELDWKSKNKDTVVGWHHQLNGHEFEQAPGVGDGQGSMESFAHGVAKSWTRLSDWIELPSFSGSPVGVGKEATANRTALGKQDQS